MAVAVARLGVNAPFWDDWELVPLLHKQAAGTLRLADLWSQHNEHRSFFPQILLVQVAHLTHWSLRTELLVNLAVAGAGLVVIFILLRGTLGVYGRPVFAIGAVGAAFVVFSPTQWENWLWAWELSWFLLNLGILGAAALLTHWPWRLPVWVGVACATGAAVVASYSLAAGLAVWVAFLPIFILRPRLRRALPGWILAGVLTWTLFLRGYTMPNGGRIGVAMAHPGAFFRFVLYYLGGPATLSATLGAGAGALLLLVFVVSVAFLVRRDREALRMGAAWLGVGLFGLAAAVITAVGRLDLAQQTSASRYVTLSNLFAISALVLALLAAGSYRAHARPFSPAFRGIGLAGLILVSTVIAAGYDSGFHSLHARHDILIEGRSCLATVRDASDPCLLQLYPSGAVAWTRLEYLREAKLAGQR